MKYELFRDVPTPAYIVDESLLKRNLEILENVSRRCGCKILLAQKAFSMYCLYPLIVRYLSGTTASSLFEARLGHEEMGGETHIYSPAYPERDFDEITRVCDHVVFNSFAQWRRFRPAVEKINKKISCGIRVNPEYAEVGTELYNPCAPGSRLGVTIDNFEQDNLDGIDGLHFHTMCEQGADVLARTLEHVERKFGSFLHRLKWLNLGGGHHITRDGYDIDLLVSLVKKLKDKYGVEVYLEPGEAVALNTGFLLTRVLDTVKNGVEIAILDASAACHMPDVLEMPYRPAVETLGGQKAGRPGEYKHTFRLAGNTCLAGDVIGDYSFDNALGAGDLLIFQDMAIYTMVKNNTFNGIGLPSIAVARENHIELVKIFGYQDFKGRL